MALTEKKRKFAAALKSGASNKEAAIAAGYSENSASQAGSRLAKDPEVLAEMDRKGAVEKAKAEHKPMDLSQLAGTFRDPKAFLEAMMNDMGEDPKLRFEAAKTLLPYSHAKKGELGKKEQADAKSEKVAAGRFSRAAPPQLVVNNK